MFQNAKNVKYYKKGQVLEKRTGFIVICLKFSRESHYKKVPANKPRSGPIKKIPVLPHLWTPLNLKKRKIFERITII